MSLFVWGGRPATALASGIAIPQDAGEQTSIRIQAKDRSESAVLTIDQSVIAIGLSGSVATQESSLLVDRASRVNYTMTSAAPGTSADVTLHAVVGNVTVVQTAQAAGAKLSLDLAGGGFTTGGVDLRQSSPGAVLALKVNAGGPNYTIKVSQ